MAAETKFSEQPWTALKAVQTIGILILGLGCYIIGFLIKAVMDVCRMFEPITSKEAGKPAKTQSEIKSGMFY